MFGKRAPKSSLDARYQPLQLLRAPIGVPEGPEADAARLRHWTSGIAIGTPVFVVAATIIRGWQDATALQFIAVIGLLALLWSYLLACAAQQENRFRHLDAVPWVNSVVLLTLTTMMMSLTGGPLSPLFGLYLILIAGETLQDRHRGLVVAWCSLALFSGLIIAEALRWWPNGWGVPWDASPLNTKGLPYALGIALFYLVIAIGVSAFSQWIALHERRLREQYDGMAKREQVMEGECAKLQAEYQEIGQRIAQLNQERRRFTEERERWTRQRQLQDLQRAPAPLGR